MKEVAPGVGVPAETRRILYRSNPRATDYLAARDEVAAIRREMAALRSRLSDVARTESYYWWDSTCNHAASALNLCISGLHPLLQKFERRAEQVEELWADAVVHPQHYLIEDKKP